MAFERLLSSSVYIRRRRSHPSIIFENLPIKVDWSNRSPAGSNGGTLGAVVFSIAVAAIATVRIPEVAASAVDSKGIDWASDWEDEGLADAALAFVLFNVFLGALVVAADLHLTEHVVLEVLVNLSFHVFALLANRVTFDANRTDMLFLWREKRRNALFRLCCGFTYVHVRFWPQWLIDWLIPVLHVPSWQIFQIILKHVLKWWVLMDRRSHGSVVPGFLAGPLCSLPLVNPRYTHLHNSFTIGLFRPFHQIRLLLLPLPL